MSDSDDETAGSLKLNTEQFATLSDLLQRARLASGIGAQFGGLRQLYEVLGYKKSLSFTDYLAQYERGHIAARVIEAPAAATWRRPPVIQEDDDENHETAFEAAWSTLEKRLSVWSYFDRVDRLAGIGRYAVLLIGVRGSGQLKDELSAGSLTRPEDVIYLSPFSERHAPIKQWVIDPGNPRFGQPEMYEIDFSAGLTEFKAGKQLVHHSRVLHVADGLLEDEVYGRPRLQTVFNLLDDLAKVVGGSAEMFWQGAYRGLHADLRDGATLGPEDEETLSAEVDEFVHGLRRFIRTQGMDLKTLPSDVSDPKNHFDVLISLIAGATGIPKRVLLGAERGELASSQDETNWNAHVAERQLHFAEPHVLRPFIDRLIMAGALPTPAEPYKVKWPNLFELDDKEKAEVIDRIAGAIQKFAPFGETDRVVPVSEFREKYLGLDPEPPEDLARPEDDDSSLDGDDGVDKDFRRQVRRGRDGEEDDDEGPDE